MLFNFFNWKNRAVTYTFFTAFTKNENECSYALYCCGCISCSDVSNFLQSHGLQPVRFLCPWNSPGKNTRVICHSLLQGIFLTQQSNTGLPHCTRYFTIWANREVLWTAREFPRLNFIIFPRKRLTTILVGFSQMGQPDKSACFQVTHGLRYSEYNGTPLRSSFQKTEIPILPTAGSVDCWQLTVGLFSWNYSQPKKLPHQC